MDVLWKAASKNLDRALMRALRILHNDDSSAFEELPRKSNECTIHMKRLQKLILRPRAHENGSVRLCSFLVLIQNFSGVHTGSEPKYFACTRERIQVDTVRDKYIFDVDIPRRHELNLFCIRNWPQSLSAPFWIRSVGSNGSQMDRSHTAQFFLSVPHWQG